MRQSPIRPVPPTPFRALSVACLLLLSIIRGVPSPAAAAMYVVRPNGSGDFQTIRAAISAAVDGDVIELTDGIFFGTDNANLDFLGKAITVRSQGGNPETCTIDCQGVPGSTSRAFTFQSGEGTNSVLHGIRIRHGNAADDQHGAAILCLGSASPRIDGCWFVENHAEGSAGAIACMDGTSPQIADCSFVGNYANWGGGSIYLYHATGVTVTDCEFTGNLGSLDSPGIYCAYASIRVTGCSFRDNTTNGYVGRGAGLYAASSDAVIENCLFAGNDVGSGELNVGAALYLFGTTFDIRGCTFHGNRASQGGAIFCHQVSHGSITGCTFTRNSAPSGGGGIYLHWTDLAMDSSIVAFSESGEAVVLDGSNATLGCCDLHGNAGGDWTGDLAGQLGVRGNIALDPLFCDLENMDLRIRSDSPCAPFTPPNPECDLIGAWPAECTPPVPVVEESWGRVKSRFR